MDFGLVADKRKPTEESQGALIGSPSYMAPEAYFEVRDRTESDLFSLGTVMLECLSAQRAFAMSNHESWIQQYGKIPYFNDYGTSVREIKYQMDTWGQDLKLPPAKVGEVEAVLDLEPIERYKLWTIGDPEQIFNLLQERLRLAMSKLEPYFGKKECDDLNQSVFKYFKHSDEPGTAGSVTLKSTIDRRLQALTCDEELKAILIKLFDLDFEKRTGNGYVLARDLAKIAVKHDPDLRLVEPFYTLIGRATSVSTEVEPEVEIVKPVEVVTVEEEGVVAQPKRALMKKAKETGMVFWRKLVVLALEIS